MNDLLGGFRRIFQTLLGLALLLIGNASYASFSPIILQMEPIDTLELPIFTFITRNLDTNQIEPYSFVVGGIYDGFSGVNARSYQVITSELQIGTQKITNYCQLQGQTFVDSSPNISLTNQQADDGSVSVGCQVTSYPMGDPS